MLLRKPAHVYSSGLLINLAGTIVWWAYSPSGATWPEWNLADMAGLVQANVLCLAIGSVVWSLVELLPRGVPNWKAERQPPFAHLAAQLGAVGARAGCRGLGVCHYALRTDSAYPLNDSTGLRWRASSRPRPFVFASAARISPCRRSIVSACRPLAWDSWPGNSRRGCSVGRRSTSWPATPWPPRRSPGSLPRSPRRRSGSPALQAAVIAVAGMLALWVTIDFNFDGCHYESLRWCLAGRMAAVPGLFLLLLAAIVMAGVAA